MSKVLKSAVEHDLFGQCFANEEKSSQLVSGEDDFVKTFRQPVIFTFFVT